MQAADRMGETDDKGKRKGIRVAKDLFDCQNDKYACKSTVLTAIATTKFWCGNFLILTKRVHSSAASHDTIVCTKRMTGIIQSSFSLSAESCEESLLKTDLSQP